MRIQSTLFTLAIAAAAAGDLPAHGGVYRGPGDVVPPAPGGRGGRTPGAAPGARTPGPKTPRPGRPSTPGPTPVGTPGTTPGPGPRPGTTTGGIVLSPDLTQWQFWWEFNKDPFLRLRDAVHKSGTTTGDEGFFRGLGKEKDRLSILAPTRKQLRGIAKRLCDALEQTDQRDITSSCLIGLGKIGRDPDDRISLLNVFPEHLTSKDQEIRETAALAMGISQREAAVDTLIALVDDSPEGRKLTDRAEVDDRTRTFATYGLGLIAHATTSSKIKQQVFECVKRHLEAPRLTSRNLEAALIITLGQLRPDPVHDRKLTAASLDTLEQHYLKPMGPGRQMLQAHCPSSAAKLLANTGSNFDAARARWRDLLARELQGKAPVKVKRSHRALQQSAALALGSFCDPVDSPTSKHFASAQVLANYYKSGRDAQARSFALMSIGRMGGEWSRQFLLIALDTGQKSIERPWAAMAVGVQQFRARERAEKAGSSWKPDGTIGAALERGLQTVKDPAARGAFPIAIGLAGWRDAAPRLRELLLANEAKEELAGYACIGLALLDDRRSTEVIQSVIDRSVRRPDLLRQASVALGKLGDKSVADRLLAQLQKGSRQVARMSAIASAIAFIGDRRTIEPLDELLFDPDLTDLSRAFAAAALGAIGDKERLPFNSKIGVGLNYRAAVETLTNGASGILDIL